jgi:recombination protein RecR
MLGLPEILNELIHRLSRLPGIGPRAAERLALALIAKPPAEISALAHALNEAVARVTPCPNCGCLSQDGRDCAVCIDGTRDQGLICVVESALDSVALEKGGNFHGLYHVLGGAISPLSGVLPDDLSIRELLERVAKGEVRELILATNASPEGEATALYIRQELDELQEQWAKAAAQSADNLNGNAADADQSGTGNTDQSDSGTAHPRIRVTRLARGLPSGSQLDYADAATLQSALDYRTEI